MQRILPEGEAVAHTTEGEVFHLRHGVPDDEVLLQPTGKRRGVAYAALTQVVRASAMRVAAPCVHAEQCGGCALQHVVVQEQAHIKSAWVQHAFQQVWQSDTAWHPVEAIEHHDASARRRVRWQVTRDEGQVCLGFFAYRSHQVVDTPHCMVLTQPLQALRAVLLQALEQESALPESVYAVQVADGIMVVLEDYAETALQALSLPELMGDLPVHYWARQGHRLKAYRQPVPPCHDVLPTHAGEALQLRLGPDDFLQGQWHGNQQMICQLLDWCADARFVVDFFAGIGNLSLPLAAAGAHVLGAEVCTSSVRAAQANAKRLKLSATYQQADLFRSFDIAPFVGADVLLLDPPRKGARMICKQMSRLLPRRVVMIHCDVRSAQQDAQVMQQQGYRLRALRALDLFMYSGHVESMSLWTQ